MAPDVVAQMGLGPQFGAGVGAAQGQMGKSPIETTLATVEKLLMAIQDETFRPFAQKMIATGKVGLSQVNQKQPMSAGIGAPPPGGAPPQIPMPPTPGQMPA